MRKSLSLHASPMQSHAKSAAPLFALPPAAHPAAHSAAHSAAYNCMRLGRSPSRALRHVLRSKLSRRKVSAWNTSQPAQVLSAPPGAICCSQGQQQHGSSPDLVALTLLLQQLHCVRTFHTAKSSAGQPAAYQNRWDRCVRPVPTPVYICISCWPAMKVAGCWLRGGWPWLFGGKVNFAPWAPPACSSCPSCQQPPSCQQGLRLYPAGMPMSAGKGMSADSGAKSSAARNGRPCLRDWKAQPSPAHIPSAHQLTGSHGLVSRSQPWMASRWPTRRGQHSEVSWSSRSSASASALSQLQQAILALYGSCSLLLHC